MDKTTSNQFDFSVLFLIFNRPDSTAIVFESIRKAKPKRLFVAADGPRPDKPADIENCNKARAVIQQVDWDCELHTLFRETNLGCRTSVSSAITWFFENVEEGIILEDDCLPDSSFFPYCVELLERFRNDNRIMHIGGYNAQFGRKFGEGSYYFSQFCLIWGWASWRRAWQLYQADIPDYPAFLRQSGFNKVFRYRDMRKYYSVLFDKTYNHKISSWAYQLFYAVLKNNGLCIVPNDNLIENVGFSSSGSHTAYNNFGVIKKFAVRGLYKKLMMNTKRNMAFPLVHPDLVLPDYQADRRYFRNIVYFFFMRIYLIFFKYLG